MTFTISKPYPNFHSARMKSPGVFKSIVVLKTLPNGIMIYGGQLKTKPRGSAVTQAYRFPKSKFTVAEAKKWLKEHKKKYILFEPAAVEKSLGRMLWKRLNGLEN